MFVPASSGGHPRYAAAIVSELARVFSCRLVYLGPSDVRLPADIGDVEIATVLPPITQSGSYRSRLQWALSRVAFYTRRDFTLVRWLLRRRDVAILHLQEDLSPWMAPLVLAAARYRGQRIVATVHNVRPHATGSRLSRARERLAHRALSSYAAVFVHQALDREETAKRLGVRPDHLVRIRHGVFYEECDPPQRDDKTLLFFGSWRRNKGLLELIKAMTYLGEGWRLGVMGAGVDVRYAEECLNAASGSTTFRRGFVPEDEIRWAFQAHAACVLPYTQLDAQSGVLHLAIGCGRPVVVTPVGGMAAVVREFGCGVVADGASPEEIAEAIRRLFEPSRFTSARDGAQRARQALDWTDAAERTAVVYRHLLRGRGRARREGALESRVG